MRIGRSEGRGIGREKVRRRTASLLVWALLLGCLALHSGPEQHEALDGAKQVFLTCAQAGASHLDTARTVEQPPCPACLLQLQTLAFGAPAPVVIPALVRFDGTPPVVAVVAGRIATRLAPARAPPLA